MNEKTLKAWIVAISVVLLVGSSVACGQTDSQAAGRHKLDQVIPRLPSGLSTDEVEERLGNPDVKFEAEDSEVVLMYRLWQLVFRPSLYKRSRRYLAGDPPGDQPVAPLDRKVRALNLGSSRETVEQELGKTEAWQVLDFGSNERLWYGNGRWKLHFSDQRLSGKTLYS